MNSIILATSIVDSYQNWLGSQSAANFAALLSSVVACGLLILAVVTFRYGASCLKRWQDEQRIAKRSNIAESVLDSLDIYKIKMDNWLKGATSFFVYSRDSQANLNQMNSIADEEKKKLQESFDNDPYEIRNFSNEGKHLADKLIFAKNHAWRLNNKIIDERFVELETIMKNAMYSLNILHFINATNDQKIVARKDLNNAIDQIKLIIIPIYEELRKYLLFD